MRTTSSSRVRTYRRMASTGAMSPRPDQLVHLALSTALHPHGLPSVHGPLLTWP